MTDKGMSKWKKRERERREMRVDGRNTQEKKRGEGTDRTSERDGGGWEKNATWTTELNDKAKDVCFFSLRLYSTSTSFLQ